MQRLRSSILLALVAVAALAQTASQKPSVDVRRVGHRLKCQCGCPDSVASCSMLECHFSKPAKERIAQMQAEGTADAAIVQTFVKEYGPNVYLAEPNAFGWIIPYAMIGLGGIAILYFVKRSRRLQPATAAAKLEIDDPALLKYKDQIEKDLANLE